jgi:hypothetical protein
VLFGREEEILGANFNSKHTSPPSFLKFIFRISNPIDEEKRKRENKQPSIKQSIATE